MAESHKLDEWDLRNRVGRWLRIRAEHIEDSVGFLPGQFTKEQQELALYQLAIDAEHSWLLARLLAGEEPMSFETWKRAAQ